ncbi:MAG: protein kinase [Deltaproteobacteria bacterium]|nr:protein kinase [Deltaproteobacteria bacterium]
MGDPKPGDRIDRRYALRRVIAEGGGGIVFEAEHLLTTRPVAVKLLREHDIHNAAAKARLLREAKALTVARHPNVVGALDAGETEDGNAYLVMELLEGRTLAGILAARRRTGVADAVHVGCTVGQALAVAHERGVVHRDVKPGNLFVALDGAGGEVIKLLDFGIASLSGAAEESSDSKLTMRGEVLGTPEYMAPEQLLAEGELDRRCDVYGLGTVLYECLSGSVPFEGRYGQVLLQASTQGVPPLRSRAPEIPAALAAVVEKALCRERAARWADARDFARALAEAAPELAEATALLAPPPDSAQPFWAREAERSTLRGAGPVSGRGAATPLGRRRFPRAPYITPVHTRGEGTYALFGRSEDVSEGGLLVLTALTRAPGERLWLRFALPATGRVVEVEAVVRWARPGRELGAVGFEFVDLPAPERALIREYVASLTTHSG